MSPQISPDGRWIAYTSNSSDQLEVYIEPIVPGGAARQVSVVGGRRPHWRADGRELYFVSERRVMAVDVKPSSTFEVGPQKEVFRHPNMQFITGLSTYTVTADGQRFLINSVVEQTGTTIMVVTNWLAALKR